MTTSINGFGRTLYGKRDFDSDGSYITTKWLIMVFFPIVPSESLRVRDLGGGEYEILEELPVCWPQALQTYAYWFGVIPLAVSRFDHVSGFSSFLLASAVAALPFVLRGFSKKPA